MFDVKLQFDLSNERLQQLFCQKYAQIKNMGWRPTLRLNWNYFLPSDYYEAIVDQLVTESTTTWLDVGGGRDIFPENTPLAIQLSKRCKLLFGIDPCENILQNKYVHDRQMCLLEDSNLDAKFDLVTARMVAEHVENPEAFVDAIFRNLESFGIVVIFTVDYWSVAPLVARFTPMWFHHFVKKWLWGSAEEDTFPVVYKMNTRRQLSTLFSRRGFQELSYSSLDDLSGFSMSSSILRISLACRRILKLIGLPFLPFPDRCILAVYQKST
jgi:2-polyprenyl-3-methyl-5-hydroxy-6-metoxy-1,4-benzoquinol methylase